MLAVLRILDTLSQPFETCPAPLLRGYLLEDDLWLIKQGGKGRFIPEDPSLQATNVQLTTIAYAASDHLDIPYLASIYDGGIAVEPSQGKSLHPVNANHRLT